MRIEGNWGFQGPANLRAGAAADTPPGVAVAPPPEMAERRARHHHHHHRAGAEMPGRVHVEMGMLKSGMELPPMASFDLPAGAGNPLNLPGLFAELSQIMALIQGMNPGAQPAAAPAAPPADPAAAPPADPAAAQPAAAPAAAPLAAPAAPVVIPPAAAAPAAAPAVAPPAAGGAAPAAAGNGNDTPFIDQTAPAGADASYTNGDNNCSPTTLAMIARSMGKGVGLTDAQLIKQLMAAGGTDATGTSDTGAIAAAQSLGLKTVDHMGSDTQFIADELKKGKKVEVLGEATDANGAPIGGHAMAVVGMDAAGNFIVNDPGRADGSHVVYTPAQLSVFLAGNGGGESISIAAA